MVDKDIWYCLIFVGGRQCGDVKIGFVVLQKLNWGGCGKMNIYNIV